MPPRLDLDVTFAARRPWAPRRADFVRWADATLVDGAVKSRLGRGGSCRVRLSVRVVGTASSRALNARFRNRDRATNVLSFGGAGLIPDSSIDLGELVICAPVVSWEASHQGKSKAAHWAHLTVHGVLHLLGFDHERAARARDMEGLEIRILDGLGFPNPYLTAGS